MQEEDKDIQEDGGILENESNSTEETNGDKPDLLDRFLRQIAKLYKRRKSKRGKRIIKQKHFVVLTAIVYIVVAGSSIVYDGVMPQTADTDYNSFIEMVENNQISKVAINRSRATFLAYSKDGELYRVTNPDSGGFKLYLLESGVEIVTVTATKMDALVSILSVVITGLIVGLLGVYITNTMMSTMDTIFKVMRPEETIGFDSVAGMSESKEEVKFAVSQLRNRDKLKSCGAVPTRGIILEGPPGTGKTLLAKAIAGEAGVPFISTSGSDFIQMYVGLGALRVRSLWQLAIINSPCVVFIDEIDAIGTSRNTMGSNSEHNQTLNALLERMDGIGGINGIIVIGATNRIDDLDPALVRPGRFDKKLYIGPPKSKKDRDEVISVHAKNKVLAEGVTIDSISKFMFGMSGADIAQVMNEAVLISISDGREGVISVQDVDMASMKLMSSGVVDKHTSEQDRRIAAIHESGHAVVSSLLGRKIAKVSIVPFSSGIGGVTISDTEELDGKRFKSSNDIITDIKVLLGGRVAEEIILGDTSIGCSNDIERASVLAYEYINSYGMGENLLNITSITKHTNTMVSNKEYVIKADKLLIEAEKSVRELLSKHSDELLRLTDELLEKEVVIDYRYLNEGIEKLSACKVQ